jgi:ABC-type branched-subunit amino acid transport system ATPase component
MAPAAPEMLADLFAAPDHLRREDMTLLLVDHMAGLALRLADRAYVIERGRISAHEDANSIRNDPALTQAYLGA